MQRYNETMKQIYRETIEYAESETGVKILWEIQWFRKREAEITAEIRYENRDIKMQIYYGRCRDNERNAVMQWNV